MLNPANIADLVERWRPLRSDELPVASSKLNDAWALLQFHRPQLGMWMMSGAVSVELVIPTLAAMVLRVLKNPDGFDNERLGDYSYGRHASMSDGRLYVTDEELAVLVPAGVVSSPSYTITPG